MVETRLWKVTRGLIGTNGGNKIVESNKRANWNKWWKQDRGK